MVSVQLTDKQNLMFTSYEISFFNKIKNNGKGQRRDWQKHKLKSSMMNKQCDRRIRTADRRNGIAVTESANRPWMSYDTFNRRQKHPGDFRLCDLQFIANVLNISISTLIRADMK